MPIIGNPASGGKKPTTPTIGTATDGGTGTTVSVAFTPSTYIGKGSITYTALSSPGSISNTGSGSPITVSGLTTGTSYTFTVKGDTNYGVASDFSAASNSIAPIQPTAFESIASATGTGSSATITFSSISASYKHLQLRITGRDTSATNLDGSVNLNVGNGSIDTGSNYAYHYVSGNGGGVGVSGLATQSEITIFGSLARGGTTANIVGVSIIDIADYASTSKTKTIRYAAGVDLNGSGRMTIGSGMWNSTSAINTIQISWINNFATTTSVALYGIKG